MILKEKKDLSVLRGFVYVLDNKPYLLLSVIACFGWFSLQLIQTNLILFFGYVLNLRGCHSFPFLYLSPSFPLPFPFLFPSFSLPFPFNFLGFSLLLSASYFLFLLHFAGLDSTQTIFNFQTILSLTDKFTIGLVLGLLMVVPGVPIVRRLVERIGKKGAWLVGCLNMILFSLVFNISLPPFRLPSPLSSSFQTFLYFLGGSACLLCSRGKPTVHVLPLHCVWVLCCLHILPSLDNASWYHRSGRDQNWAQKGRLVLFLFRLFWKGGCWVGPCPFQLHPWDWRLQLRCS